MVRVVLKGGVWKNSEDEILKAAVQKYGQQQWARVASLLNRKTAKQAKARWHQWLDPAIKKAAWSRQEQEKLLHLAKLMPAQWNTIGPMLGRTALQCQEQYEALLDQAAAEAFAASSGGGEGRIGGGGVATAADSAQLLRAMVSGSGMLLDAHPEAKPARPDPVDMDEDELEMLQEARARLANTVGKKAKRKQREKMLQAAKRLADLQKRRELKQAGLIVADLTKKKRRRYTREIDLGAEIPFYKAPKAGFHDTSSEVMQSEVIRLAQWRKADYGQLNEHLQRSRDKEALQRQKKQQQRLRFLQASNDQYAAAGAKQEAQELDDIRAARPRGALNLPAPTISDAEMTAQAKWEQQQQLAAAAGQEDGSVMMAPTQALLADYANRPLPTPMRTPAAAAASVPTEASIMQSAKRLQRLAQRGATPLFAGGANQGDEPDIDYDDDDIATVSRTKGPDDNDNETNKMPVIRDQRALNNRTPSGSSVVHPSSNLIATRDAYSLNPAAATTLADDAVSVGASTFAATASVATMSIRQLARQERLAAKQARKQLQESLAALPVPQYEYELALPEDADVAATITEDESDIGRGRSQGVMTADQGDIERAEMQQLIDEAQRSYAARNTVLKRPELPRPRGALTKILQWKQAAMDSSALAVEDNLETVWSCAQQLIDEEMIRLLQQDASSFPMDDEQVAMADADGALEEPLSALVGSSKKSRNKKKGKRKRESSSQDLAAPLQQKQAPMTIMPVPVDPLLPDITTAALDEAQQLIQAEQEALWNEKLALTMQQGGIRNVDEATDLLLEANIHASQQGAASMVYRKDHGGWMTMSTTDLDSNDESENSVVTEQYQAQVDVLQAATAALRKKNDRTAAKLQVLTAGYRKRADALREQIQNDWNSWQDSCIEQAIYQQLEQQERVGATKRIQDLERNIAALKGQEVVLQKRYSDLLVMQKLRQREQQKMQQQLIEQTL